MEPKFIETATWSVADLEPETQHVLGGFQVYVASGCFSCTANTSSIEQRGAGFKNFCTEAPKPCRS